MFVSFLGMMALGVPIAFGLGVTGALGLYLVNPTLLPLVPQEIFRSLNSFPLLTIPLFILAGTIMAQGGVANRLMDLATLTVGRGRGGLGAAIVVATMFFHGISGSSTADTAAIGRVTLPALRRQGYPVPFSTAMLAAAGATATLIPPTIDLIIIGIVANMSIAALFAAGVIPAIINGVGLVCMVVYLAHRRGYGTRTSASMRETLKRFFTAIPALFMIVIILGGILGGVFTPTEASAVAVIYGLLISMFVYRDLKLSMFPQILRNTAELTGMVLLVIAGGAVFSYSMTFNRVPRDLALSLESVAASPALFLLLVQILFFIIGMVMDGTPALLVLMPILTPIATAHGINPIHFGILVEANVALGLATPPVGLCLYAACAVANLPLERVVKPLLPLIAILVVTMLIITYVEGFSLFLPRLLGLMN
jgi:tripartite ATP-independent transporter DctM subunit